MTGRGLWGFILAGLVLLLLSGCSTEVGVAPVPAPGPENQVGSFSVSGRVLFDGQDIGTYRARVKLAGNLAITDDEGHFAMAAVPEGDWQLSCAAPLGSVIQGVSVGKADTQVIARIPLPPGFDWDEFFAIGGLTQSEGTLRWKAPSGTGKPEVRVYFDTSGAKAGFYLTAKDAVERWRQDTADFLDIVITSSPSDAGVSISWEPSGLLEAEYGWGTAGVTLYSLQDSYIRSITIRIDERYGQDPRIISHEFGHALGLAHSNNRASLMYPQVNSSMPERASPEDLIYLRAVYSLRAGVKARSYSTAKGIRWGPGLEEGAGFTGELYRRSTVGLPRG